MFTTTRCVRARYALQASIPLPRALDAVYTAMMRACEARGRFPPVLIEGSVTGAEGQTVRFRGEDGILQIQGSLPSAKGLLVMRIVYEDAGGGAHVMSEVRRHLKSRGISLELVPVERSDAADAAESGAERRDGAVDDGADTADGHGDAADSTSFGARDAEALLRSARGKAGAGHTADVAHERASRTTALRKHLLLVTLFLLVLAGCWMVFQRSAGETAASQAESEQRPTLLSFADRQTMEKAYVRDMYQTMQEMWGKWVDIEIIDGGDTGTMGEYGVRALPTQILLDAGGNEIARLEGPLTPEEMQNLLVQSRSYVQ